MSRTWRYYGKGLPYMQESDWPGRLIVLEGPDCAGRSTQIELLQTWLESEGHAVLTTGIKRSDLAAKMIMEAKEGHVQGQKTLTMLYATDLADQMENKIIPALRAGFIVLADRYIWTPMARDVMRGMKQEWMAELYGFALVPDLTIYLQTTPQERLHRALTKYQTLDWWESGMDLGLASDRFTSFLKYQRELEAQYARLAKAYSFATVDGSGAPKVVQEPIRALVRGVLTEGESGVGA